MSTTAPNISWYALHIRPRFEKVVARHLEAEGREGYLPLYKSVRRWSDRIKTIELPLFPGYMFCRFDIENRLPILVGPGVLGIVVIGTTPTPIPESDISSLRHVTASGIECKPWPFVDAGQRISVKYGPLAGLEGMVIQVKSNLRLIVSLPPLRRP